MRLLAACLLALALATAARAEGRIEVNVPHASHLEFRPQDQGSWQRLEGPPRTGTVSIPVSGDGDYEVRAETPGWFVTSAGQVDHVSPDLPAVSIRMHRRVRWDRVLGLVLMVGLPAGLLVARRLRQTHRERERTLARQVEEAESTQTLFSSDGRLPSRIGPYRVRSRLGTGGMAVVFKAEDEDGRPVAVKVPLPHLVADPEYMARFAREMRVGTSMSHPRVVRIEDVNPGGEGQYPYLAMEYVPGRPLAHPTAPVPLARVIDLASQVLDGLEYIHSLGITHRDLKPSNLMVTSAGAVKIMDFGIARREQTMGPALTKTDQTLGTPEYMAPEQISTGAVGPYTDLYAVGVMLYEQLAGSPPFQGETFEILTRKLMDDPPSLSSRRPDLDPAVVAFVEKLMARDSGDRFPDAASARAALRQLRQR